jgi:serine/threonine-protein kinase
MFHQEREAGSSVSHPHVVPVLDSILQQDLPFLIMPWLEGQTLRTHLEAGTTFSLSHALWIARQATEALNALAESRWVHNDIKPENLFLSPMGHLTLIDLGFATEFSGEGFSQQLGETPPLGTLNYMAPEKADPQCPVIPSSDLYSLGIVLFEMLAGMPPRIVHRLEDLSSHCVTREHIHAMLPPSIPSKVADLIAWMTHPCPSQRVDSARKLLRRWYELEIESFRGRPHTPRPPHFQSVTAEVHS